MAKTSRSMKMFLRQTHLMPIVALLGILLTSGCIHLEQKIQINTDGSAAVFYHYSVPEAELPTLLAARKVIDQWQGNEMDDDGVHWFTNQKAVEEHFSANGADVQVYRNYMQANRRHIEITVFTEDAAEGLNSGLFGTFELLETPDGNVLFRATPPFSGEASTTGDASENIKALADDLKITFSVETPREIVSSTAHRVEDRTATWTFDAHRDDTFLRQMPSVHLIYKGRHRVE